MGDNRPTVYFDEEKEVWVYRISGLGNCVRALAAIGQGYEEARSQDKKDLLERSAEEGNLHEGAVRDALAGLGYRFWGYDDTENEVDVPIIPGVVLRGHTDGLGAFEGEGEPPYPVAMDNNRPHTDEILLEVKSMSTKQFSKWMLQRWDAFPKYAYQISGYMRKFPERDALYVVKRREDGLTDIHVIPHDQPPVPFSVVRRKVIVAEKFRRSGGWPACDIRDQWFCDFWYLHDEDEELDQADFLTEDMEELLGELVEEYRKLKEIEEAGKEAEKKRKEINPEILNLLGKLDQAEIVYQGQKFRVTRGKGGGSTIDKERLKVDLGEETFEKYLKRFRYEYPLIRPVE